MSHWQRLRRGLEPPGAEAAAAAGDERLAAALVLLSEAPAAAAPPPGPAALEVVYIRRGDHLVRHPGQIAFPGGRVDAGETVEQAALREAAEEIGLDSATAEILGRLPPVFVPPSGFWLRPVVARWHTPHPLRCGEGEVTDILRVGHRLLTDPHAWRVVRLPEREVGWGWHLGDEQVLWGATASATAALLDVLEPGWRGGLEPDSLGPAREIDPHESPPGRQPR